MFFVVSNTKLGYVDCPLKHVICKLHSEDTFRKFHDTSNIHVTVNQRLKSLTQKSTLTIRQI